MKIGTLPAKGTVPTSASAYLKRYEISKPIESSSKETFAPESAVNGVIATNPAGTSPFPVAVSLNAFLYAPNPQCAPS